MSVRFSDINQVFIIPNNQQEDRSIGSMYYRNLIYNCENAERDIVKMINDNCKNKILLISEGYPLTVRNLELPWYRDDTVCKIYNQMIYDIYFAHNFYELFDHEVDKNVDMFSMKEFIINIDNVQFYFNKIIRLPL
jgi:hypothetical protein